MDIGNPYVEILYDVLFSAAIVLVALGCYFLIARRLPRFFLKTNFQGRQILSSAGLAFAVPFAFNLSEQKSDIKYYAFGLGVTGFALVGLLDDLLGDRSAGGFRGHFRKLFRDRKLTTGVVKVIGGGAAALTAAWIGIPMRGVEFGPMAAPEETQRILLLHILAAALLIALSANTCNLLDLRPGRCLLFVVLASLPLISQNTYYQDPESYYCSVFVGTSAFVLYLFDSRAKLMIGDTGSNALGAGLGMCYGMLMPLWAIVVLVAILAAFQVWCEKHSLSKFIESKPILRALDRKIGVR